VNGALQEPTFSWQVATSSQTAIPNRGYIADSTDPVTITLPTNANIGDVIRINGLGDGWVASGAWQGQSIITYLTSYRHCHISGLHTRQQQELDDLWPRQPTGTHWSLVVLWWADLHLDRCWCDLDSSGE
jgi:hypothetical protein